MNRDERINLPRIALGTIGLIKITLPINVFGVESKAFDVVDTDAPYWLWDDGKPIVWDDGKKMLLEQDKIKVWRQKARK